MTAAMVAYFGIRNLTAGSPQEAFANAHELLDVERWLGMSWESTIQGWVVGSDTLVTLANWVYIWGHWPVLLTAATLLYLYRRDRYYLLRNAMFVSGGIGFFFFAVVPVAPPRLLELDLVDTVTNESHAYRALQPPGFTNQYAAFPSLHFGWNLVLGIVLFMTTAHLAVRVFAVISPFAMGFAVIATANHFVVDIAAGAFVVMIGLGTAYAIQERKKAATLADGGSRARSERLTRAARPVPRRAPRGQPDRRPAASRETRRCPGRS